MAAIGLQFYDEKRTDITMTSEERENCHTCVYSTRDDEVEYIVAIPPVMANPVAPYQCRCRKPATGAKKMCRTCGGKIGFKGE